MNKNKKDSKEYFHINVKIKKLYSVAVAVILVLVVGLILWFIGKPHYWDLKNEASSFIVNPDWQKVDDYDQGIGGKEENLFCWKNEPGPCPAYSTIYKLDTPPDKDKVTSEIESFIRANGYVIDFAGVKCDTLPFEAEANDPHNSLVCVAVAYKGKTDMSVGYNYINENKSISVTLVKAGGIRDMILADGSEAN